MNYITLTVSQAFDYLIISVLFQGKKIVSPDFILSNSNILFFSIHNFLIIPANQVTI